MEDLNNENQKAGFPFKPFNLIVILLTCAVAISTLAYQFHLDPDSELALISLYQRGTLFKQTTDPVKRDLLCVPLAAYSQMLNRALPKDSRIFVSNMLGPTNSGSLGYYFFLRHYLYPREVAISLDGKGYFTMEGCQGIPCDSPYLLQSNGFDLLVAFQNNHVGLVPLSPKGVPKSQ